MDNVFEQDVAKYKANFDVLENEIKTRTNGILMLEKTLKEAEEKGVDDEQKHLIFNAIEEERDKYDYLEEIKRTIETEKSEEAKIKYRVSEEDKEFIQKIHDIEVNPVKEKKENPIREDLDIIFEGWHSTNSLMTNGIECTNSVRHPVLDYCFLVKLPDILNTRVNEVTQFFYTLPERHFLKKYGMIDVSVRESVNSGQLINALKNRGKDIYGQIRFVKTDTTGEYQYTLIFTGLKLENITDDCYSYNTQEPHKIHLQFKYKKVDYLTKETANEATTKKDTSNKTDKEEKTDDK